MADQLVVTALLHDLSPEHDEDAVDGADGGKPVRDDEGGAVLQQPRNAFPDEVLGFRVDVRSRLVEDQRRRRAR